MPALDNSKLIAEFVNEVDDNDTFCYTELLDRTKKGGNNNARLVDTFYHRSREQFWRQWPKIQRACDFYQVRAYTRLAPRSLERVGILHAQLVVEAALTRNYGHQESLYSSACGRASPKQKLWLFDVDAITDNTEALAKLLQSSGFLRGRIPSRKGEHLITIPFDPRSFVGNDPNGWKAWGEVSLHKDNPTNLYIPEGAA